MRRRNVAYIRVANEDDYAVELQKKLIDHYAETKNFKIDYYYIDNGYSGITLDRPQLRQMLRDVKSKKITDRIVFKDSTRLSRNQSDLLKIINQLNKRNVNLISTLEEEMLHINMMAMFGKFERDDSKQRKIIAQKFREERGAVIYSPYKNGTPEDLQFKHDKRLEFKNKGINHITFRNKEDRKKVLSNETR